MILVTEGGGQWSEVRVKAKAEVRGQRSEEKQRQGPEVGGQGSGEKQRQEQWHGNAVAAAVGGKPLARGCVASQGHEKVPGCSGWKLIDRRAGGWFQCGETCLCRIKNLFHDIKWMKQLSLVEGLTQIILLLLGESLDSMAHLGLDGFLNQLFCFMRYKIG